MEPREKMFENVTFFSSGYAYSAQRQLFGGGRGGGGGNRQSQYRWQASDYNKPVTAQMSTNEVMYDLFKFEVIKE